MKNTWLRYQLGKRERKLSKCVHTSSINWGFKNDSKPFSHTLQIAFCFIFSLSFCDFVIFWALFFLSVAHNLTVNLLLFLKCTKYQMYYLNFCQTSQKHLSGAVFCCRSIYIMYEDWSRRVLLLLPLLLPPSLLSLAMAMEEYQELLVCSVCSVRKMTMIRMSEYQIFASRNTSNASHIRLICIRSRSS